MNPSVGAAPKADEGRPWRRVADYARSHVLVVAGFLVILFFVALAVLAPVIAPGDPNAMSGPLLQPPSVHHWLGTTAQGQDVWAQLVWGTRVSLIVGAVAGVLSVILAIVVGVTGAFIGGTTDDVAVLLANIFLIIPSIPLMVVLASYLPNEGEVAIIAVIAITSWPWAARVLRSQTLALRQREFVRLARIGGDSLVAIVWHEILPNLISLVAVMQLNAIMGAIVAQASLQFLGLGNISVVSWGSMLYWASNYQALLSGAWWWVFPPGLCVALIGGSLALLNRGIDELSNPQLRAARRGRLTEVEENA